MEVSYSDLTWSFGEICANYCAECLPRDNINVCVIEVHATKVTQAKLNSLAGLATKIGGTITDLHT